MSGELFLDHSLPGQDLTDADFKMLESSYIPRALAEQQFLRRVSSQEGAALMARRDSSNYAGIVFPYLHPGGRRVHGYRLRRDVPPIEHSAEGKPKEVQKYLAPAGQHNSLYFVHQTPVEHLTDIGVPVAITEGEKKTLAIANMLTLDVLPVGISGVSNWRGKTGKGVTSTGARTDIKGPISDLSMLTLEDRLVYVVFDADVSSNWIIRQERYKLARYLSQERKARVRFVEIPPAAGLKGIDDLLFGWGDQRVRVLFDQAVVARGVEEAFTLIDQVKQANDPKALFEAIALFAGLDGTELAEVRARVRAQLRGILSTADFDRAVEAAKEKPARPREPDPEKDNLTYAGQTYEANDHGTVWWKPVMGGGRTPVYLCNFQARIVADVVRDDGEETSRAIKIAGVLGGSTKEFIVSASEFAAMNWPIEHMGARANVYPNYRDHLRSAIQQFSQVGPEEYLYLHTGWATVSGKQVYLHAGGGIGEAGLLSGLKVELERRLRFYSFGEPPKGSDLANAVRASLRTLELAPARITYPLYAAIWRSTLGPTDLSLFLSGQTGAGKSQLAALAQQHWGAEMDAKRLPADWSATANALEAMAHRLKDSIFVIDDFVPHGSAQEVSKMHSMADRLLRAQAGGAGRQRMTADIKLRPPKTPRGLILATGEDTPKGHSLRSRMILLELSPDDMRWPELTPCQADAAAGLYSQAMAGFLTWLAPQMAEMEKTLQVKLAKFRAFWMQIGGHRRTPENVSNLAIGMDFFLRFAIESGALSQAEAARLWTRSCEAYAEMTAAQEKTQAASDPCQQFFELLNGVLATGRGHVATTTGDPPDEPGSWGWQKESTDRYGDSYVPRGERIGWIDDDCLYLEPMASFAAAQRMATAAGENIPVALPTLKRRFSQRRIVASTDTKRETVTIRRVCEGRPRDVLHFTADILDRFKGATAGLENKMSGFCFGLSGDFGDPTAIPTAATTEESGSFNGNVGFVGFSTGRDGPVAQIPEGDSDALFAESSGGGLHSPEKPDISDKPDKKKSAVEVEF